LKKALTVGLHIRHKARLHGRLTDVEFHSASTMQEALEVIEGDGPFDLLVLDENMPDSGLFLQKIRPLKIPTVCCLESEKSTGFMKSLVQDLQVDCVLIKPVDPDEMVRKTGELLSASRRVEDDGLGVQDEMKARLAALWEKFGPTNQQRLQTIKEQILDHLDGDEKDENDRREMEREAHKMVGALGTFGFPQATVLAREIEFHVSPTKNIAPIDGHQLILWIQAIERELNRGPQGQLKAPEVLPGKRILLVSESEEISLQLRSLELDGEQPRVERVASWHKARESWFLRAPDLVILDLCGETAEERQTLLSSVAAKLSTIPVLVLLPKEVWNQPEALTRFAGFPVLFHPYEPELLNSTIHKLLSGQDRPKPKVLAVDDDPQILDALTVLLAPLKLEITTLADPLEFWDVLERTDPDLLILDIDMPYLSGIELCRGVRSSARWWQTPVLFLSASSDPENLNRIFAVGADDFVPKPFTGPELATRVVNRLVRSKGSQTVEQVTDFKSGLDGLRNVLAEEQWQNSTIVVGLVRVWNDDDLVNNHGVAVVSKMNRQLGVRLADSLRGMGAVARWRSHEFVVALPGQTLEAGSHLLSTLLSQGEITDFPLGTETISFQVVAGTTSMNNAEQSLEAALRQCHQSLEGVDPESSNVHAREMTSVSEDSAQVEKCQLLILEPDSATGEAVKNLFLERGYDTSWMPDTVEAVQRLTSDPPTLEAKAVFISSGGLQLLSKLGPVTRLINVVVAVSTEAELVKAFDTGAYDCLEKPCKVGTLLKRLERAVGA
jgi:DNA-binding response OmpR family regulator